LIAPEPHEGERNERTHDNQPAAHATEIALEAARQQAISTASTQAAANSATRVYLRGVIASGLANGINVSNQVTGLGRAERSTMMAMLASKKSTSKP
jgi:hypothetical protein